MHKQFYFLSPVEVVKVTMQNLQEVAEWCGGSIHETPSRRVKGRMDKYVLVPTPSEKNISWAFPGMYITKRLVVTIKDELRATYAVFRRDYFDKNYFDTPKEAADKTWERENSERQLKVHHKSADIHVTVNVGEALIEAQARIAELEAERAKQADRLMVHKSDHELNQLLLGKHITQEDLNRHKGTEAGIEKVAEVNKEDSFQHAHSIKETCAASGCEVDRYIDGIHIFSDQVVHADAQGFRTEELQVSEG